MDHSNSVSRRSFLATTAASSAALAARGENSSIPVGLELYSVRHELQKDPQGTVRAVAKMGYQGVEFFAPYFSWTGDEARQMRSVLDDSGIRCWSTHNDKQSFLPEKLSRTIELNHALGCRYVVLAHPGNVADLESFGRIADLLNTANDKLNAAGMNAGYHNHDLEFRPMSGKRPIEVIAANTEKSIMLQLDVGTCIEAGSDPVAWVESNPGRIKSMHCKDWSHVAGRGYKVLFNEGDTPWKKLFGAAESVGGVEYYLIEQEGSDYPEMETARRCLDAFHRLRAS